MKIAVIGKRGQLASEFFDIKAKDNKWTFLSKNDLDITKIDQVRLFFRSRDYDIIINCSGFTNVEQAEKKREQAFNLNEKAVNNLVLACKEFNCKLIHFSTDYVFDGTTKQPYRETDSTFPINTYGKSKEAGEKIIGNSDVKSVIIRSSWIYSSFGNNFVKKIIAIVREKNKLEIVNDQIGSPTYAKDVVKACLLIINNTNYKWKNHGEIFHYSNEGECSWYEFAKEVVRLKNINVPLEPKKSKELFKAIKRPKYSVLDKSKIKSTFKIYIPDWEDSLKKIINNFK